MRVSGRRAAIRVMTWNIHGAVGRNPRFDLQRVIDLILRADPDIIALQEVDSRRVPPGEDPFRILQKELGSHGVGAKSIVAEDGEYGQTLISRWPIHGTRTHDISYGEFEPRCAIETNVSTPDGELRVIAAHLGLSIHERRSQTRALLGMVAEEGATVLLGDFNDWFWPGSVRSVLAHALPGRSRHRTFPAWCPILRLDRIYCCPAAVLEQTWTDSQARHVSDHLPVIGDIRIEAGASTKRKPGRLAGLPVSRAREYIRPRSRLKQAIKAT
jgi:endonuclease/exonuclease/phosphatase family metal-dependent hydrolase